MQIKTIEVNSINVSIAMNKTSFSADAQNVVLIHGNSSSKKAYENQLNTAELKSMNVLAIDLPGHGDTEYDPKAAQIKSVYSIPYYAEFIAAALKQLDITYPILVGHSLGAHITTELGRHIKTSGILNIQNTPFDRLDQLPQALNLKPEYMVIYQGELSRQDIVPVANAFFKNGNAPEWFYQDFLSTDPLCRTNLGASLDPEVPLNEVQFLNGLKAPYELVIGTEDKITSMKYVKEFPLSNKVVFLAGAGHFPQYDSAPHFNKILLSFLNKA